MLFESLFNNNILKSYPNTILDPNKFYDLNYIDNEIFRLSFTRPVYTIDPENCKDADDGFSLWHENNKLYLAIHIADPTSFIPISSDPNSLFQLLKKRSTSCYPSANDPIHMMPRNILNRSSLMEDSDDSDLKFAISLLLEIDKKTLLPINVSYDSLKFTVINCKNEFKFSYESAANTKNDVINLCRKIGVAMRKNRNDSIKLDSKTKIKYANSIPYFENINHEVLEVQHMIEEFAIYTNSYVGNYLYYYLCLKNIAGDNYNAIFRSCRANDIYENLDQKTITDDEIFAYLVKEGISAQYTNKPEFHEMISKEQLYTHFTSPIRRFSDCICHYLLKFIYLHRLDKDKKAPFTATELKEIIDCIHSKSKLCKKISLEDNKFRTIQCIFNRINNNSNKFVRLKCEYNGCHYNRGLKYINILITTIYVCAPVSGFSIEYNGESYVPYDNYSLLDTFNVKISSSFIINEWDEDYFNENLSPNGYLTKIFYIPIYDIYLSNRNIFTRSGKIKDNLIFNNLYLYLKNISKNM